MLPRRIQNPIVDAQVHRLNEDTLGCGSLDVVKNTLELLEMDKLRTMHKLAKSIDNKRDVWPYNGEVL